MCFRVVESWVNDEEARKARVRAPTSPQLQEGRLPPPFWPSSKSFLSSSIPIVYPSYPEPFGKQPSTTQETKIEIPASPSASPTAIKENNKRLASAIAELLVPRSNIKMTKKRTTDHDVSPTTPVPILRRRKSSIRLVNSDRPAPQDAPIRRLEAEKAVHQDRERSRDLTAAQLATTRKMEAEAKKRLRAEAQARDMRLMEEAAQRRIEDLFRHSSNSSTLAQAGSNTSDSGYSSKSRSSSERDRVSLDHERERKGHQRERRNSHHQTSPRHKPVVVQHKLRRSVSDLRLQKSCRRCHLNGHSTRECTVPEVVKVYGRRTTVRAPSPPPMGEEVERGYYERITRYRPVSGYSYIHPRSR